MAAQQNEERRGSAFRVCQGKCAADRSRMEEEKNEDTTEHISLTEYM
jgi:hypothetical protein